MEEKNKSITPTKRPPLVTEWELEHGKPFPTFAAVWHYDCYGEYWGTELWRDVVKYYEIERDTKNSKIVWDTPMEPMVCLPTDIRPKWGEGVPLKRNVEEG